MMGIYALLSGAWAVSSSDGRQGYTLRSDKNISGLDGILFFQSFPFPYSAITFII